MTAAISRLSSLTYITGGSRLQIRGGPGHPDPEIKAGEERLGGGAVLKNIFFVPLEPQFGLKIRGTPGLLGPSPVSASVYDQSSHVY